MASDAIDMDKYFVYSNRLETFIQPRPIAPKRRPSNASTRAPKTLSWPHKSIEPVDVRFCSLLAPAPGGEISLPR